MKKFNFCQPIFLTLALVFIVSFNAFAQKPNTYFITTDDKTHYIYGEKLSMDLFYLEYMDENGKKTKQELVKIKLLFTGSKVFLGFPTKKEGVSSLKEIVAFSKDYILTQKSYVGEDYFYIYKRNDLSKQIVIKGGKEDDVIKVLEVGMRSKKGKERYKQTITVNMTKYFPECPDLLEKQIKNIEGGYLINSGISYYNCGNAPDFFTNKPVEEEKVEAKSVEEEKLAEESYILTLKDEKLIANSVLRTPVDFIHYYEKVGMTAYSGLKIIHASKVKYFKFGKTLYLPLKNTKGNLYMMEVVLYTNNKILAFDNKKSTYYVFDRNYTLIAGDVKKVDVVSLLKEHFTDCKEVVTQFEDNVKFHREPKSGISNYNFGNAPKLVE